MCVCVCGGGGGGLVLILRLGPYLYLLHFTFTLQFSARITLWHTQFNLIGSRNFLTGVMKKLPCFKTFHSKSLSIEYRNKCKYISNHNRPNQHAGTMYIMHQVYLKNGNCIKKIAHWLKYSRQYSSLKGIREESWANKG